MMTFDQFLDVRKRASDAFVDGDVEPLLAISATTDPATIYPPSGAIVEGAKAVDAGNGEGAKTFAPGSENRFEILHSGSDDSLGYWTGIQRSRVVMKGKPEPVEMTLRVTELFRIENGAWKLFHRHADMLADNN